MGTPGVNRPQVAAMKTATLDGGGNSGSWIDATYTAWTSISSATLASTDVIYSLSVQNTHASQTIYLLLKANSSEATSAAHPIGPGAVLNLDLYGQGCQVLSFQGSGASTTCRCIATWGAP